MRAISDTRSYWPPVIILLVIARSKATKQSSDKPGYALLRGACHRAAPCADPLARNDDLKICGMVAYQAIISGANPIPPSAIQMADRRGGAAGERGFRPRRLPARSRVPANKRLGR